MGEETKIDRSAGIALLAFRDTDFKVTALYSLL
jgi:hypothetical protein